MELIQPYLDYFGAHPGWALAFVFLIAFGEALLIIGLFVPSTAALVGAGILVGTGHLDFWHVTIATAVGAIAGDQLSFWAGRFFGERLKLLWPLNRYPQLVAKGEDFVREHGGKSIAIGRFVPGVKAVVPGIVGMFGMSQLFFAAVNISSGIVWSLAHIVPGVLIGQGLAFAGELSGRLVFVLILLLVILAAAGYLIRLLAAGLSPYLNHVLDRVSAWAATHRSRSMQRLARAVSPRNPRSALVVVFAAVVVTGFIALANMALRYASNDAVSNMDVSIFNLMREMRNAPADELMIVLTMMGDGIVLTVLAATIIAWLIWRKSYRAAFAAAVTILAGKLFVPVMKLIIQRPRPIELYQGAEGFSFPSGHATMSALIFGILAVLVSHAMGRWGRALVYASCGVLVVAIAYSRVYLGVHWLSDVLGGLIFGAIMVAVFGVAVEAIPPRRIKPMGLFGAALIAFNVAGAIHVSTNWLKAEEFYTPVTAQLILDQKDWLQKDWAQLPERRVDLGGSSASEHFMGQYAGDLSPLEQALAGASWKPQDKWTWRDSLPYLNPHATLSELAPRPSLHEGLKAKLTMIRSIDGNDGERLVLRAYKTDHLLAGPDPRPIYMLSVTRETLRRGFQLYAIPSDRSADAADVDGLRQTLLKAAGLVTTAVADGPSLILSTP